MIETKAEDQFRVTAEALREKITPRTKLLVLPFPNNPTGAVMRKEHLEAVAQVVREHNLLVLSDEIYSELTYGKERHVSFAAIEGMGAHNCRQRLFQDLRYDRLAPWLCRRSGGS